MNKALFSKKVVWVGIVLILAAGLVNLEQSKNNLSAAEMERIKRLPNELFKLHGSLNLNRSIVGAFDLDGHKILLVDFESAVHVYNADNAASSIVHPGFQKSLAVHQSFRLSDGSIFLFARKRQSGQRGEGVLEQGPFRMLIYKPLDNQYVEAGEIPCMSDACSIQALETAEGKVLIISTDRESSNKESPYTRTLQTLSLATGRLTLLSKTSFQRREYAFMKAIRTSGGQIAFINLTAQNNFLIQILSPNHLATPTQTLSGTTRNYELPIMASLPDDKILLLSRAESQAYSLKDNVLRKIKNEPYCGVSDGSSTLPWGNKNDSLMRGLGFEGYYTYALPLLTLDNGDVLIFPGDKGFGSPKCTIVNLFDAKQLAFKPVAYSTHAPYKGIVQINNQIYEFKSDIATANNQVYFANLRDISDGLR